MMDRLPGNSPTRSGTLVVCMKCATIFLCVAGSMLRAQQSSSRPQQKNTTKATTDNWQKMKDCAAEAEKAIAERDRRSLSFGGHGSDEWSNHYSPKYNRCFVKVGYLVAAKDSVKGGP